MDEFTLSEVCYKNGFKDGQNTPIYILSDNFGITRAVSHSKESLEALLKANDFVADALFIEKFNSNEIDQNSVERVYNWNYRKHRYEF